MDKIIKLFMKMVIAITLMFLIVIFYNALLLNHYTEYLNSIVNKSEYIYWFVAGFLFFIIYVLFRYVDNVDLKKIKKLKWLLVFILIIGQFILLVDCHFIQITDPYICIDQAKAIAMGIEKHVDYTSTTYFVQYANNNFFVLLVVYITKLFKFFNIIDYDNYMVLINTIMINLSIFVLYKISVKVKDEKFALKVLTLNVLNPLNYLLIHWPYTCTMSLFFTFLIIYLFILLNQIKEINIKFIFFLSMLGFFTVFGYFFRPTIIIPIISIICCLLMYLLNNSKRAKKVLIANCWKVLGVFTVFVISSIFGFMFISNSIKKIAPDDSGSFPTTHWVMMGLHGDGQVRDDDAEFTLSYKTKSEKVKANISEMGSTLKEYGVSGFVKHLIIKLPITWSDGVSSFSYRVGTLKSKSYFYDYIYGSRNDFVLIYCQAFRILVLFLSMVTLINYIKIIKLDFNFFVSLTLFGAILFYLIWEAKNVYSVPFVPFFIFLSVDSFENMAIRQTYKFNMGCHFILFLTIISFAYFEKDFTERIIPLNVYQISNIDNFTLYVDDLNLNNKNLKQEFYVNGIFNSIDILAFENDLNDTSSYLFKLYKAKGKKLLLTKDILKDDINNNKITLKFDQVFSNKNEKYFIEILPNSKNENDSIKWGYKLSKSKDLYGGNFYVDKNKMDSDLMINVYYNYFGTYISKTKYYLFAIILIIIECLVIRLLKRSDGR